VARPANILAKTIGCNVIILMETINDAYTSPRHRSAGNDAETVMLDLVQPLAAWGQLIGFRREARRDEPGRKGTLQHVD
jgi:hypothetical protein